MEQVIKFKTVDGVLFDDKISALYYEKLIDSLTPTLAIIGYDYKKMMKVPYGDNKYRIVCTPDEYKIFINSAIENLRSVALFNSKVNSFGSKEDINGIYDSCKRGEFNHSLTRTIHTTIPETFKAFCMFGNLCESINWDGKEFMSAFARGEYNESPEKFEEVKEWTYYE